MLRITMCAAVAAVALSACSSMGTSQSASAHAAPTTQSASSSSATSRQTPAPEPSTTAQATPPAEATASPPGSTTSTPTSFTDAQLRSFAAAAKEIQPINAQLTSGTPEQRAAATAQVRQILARNNLDGATYNAIAAQAHADPALAQRIAALSTPSNSPG